jgi:hypothetical protein
MRAVATFRAILANRNIRRTPPARRTALAISTPISPR